MSSIQTLFALPRVPGGRRELALHRLLERILPNPAWTILEQPVRDAIAIHMALTELRHRYRAAQANVKLHAAMARQLDPKLDRCLSSLGATLTGLARSLDEGSALQTQAASLNDDLFPSGVGAVTSLRYVDEHIAVNRILRTLTAEDMVATVEGLGLAVHIVRLQEVNEAYGAALTQPEELTAARMKAEDDLAWTTYLSVVARIAGQFPTDAPEDAGPRTELLQPMFDQAEEHRLWRQRRGSKSSSPAEQQELEEALAFDEDAAPTEPDSAASDTNDPADATDPANTADPADTTDPDPANTADPTDATEPLEEPA